MIKKKKLIYQEGVFQIFTISGHPNGACYLLEREDGKVTFKGVIGEYYYIEKKFKDRIKELQKELHDANVVNDEVKG